jgi:hypothetical protein
MSVTAFDQRYVPSPGGRPIHARPFGVLAALMMGGAAVLVLLASLMMGGKGSVDQPQTAAAEPQAAPVPKISTQAETAAAGLVKQYAAFDLSAPEFAKEKKALSSRVLEGSDSREDSLTIGQFASNGPYMRLDIRQTAGEKLGSPDFFLDMTRHGSDAGLSVVGRIGQPSPLVTRFGSFEAADIRLTDSAAGKGAGERACLAVRLVNTKAYIQISGLACGAAAKPLDRRAMGCILDRLEYQPNGENKSLDQFFLNAELERGKGCADAGQTPTASKSSWLDAHSMAPPVKSDASPAKHKKKAH